MNSTSSCSPSSSLGLCHSIGDASWEVAALLTTLSLMSDKWYRTNLYSNTEDRLYLCVLCYPFHSETLIWYQHGPSGMQHCLNPSSYRCRSCPLTWMLSLIQHSALSSNRTLTSTRGSFNSGHCSGTKSFFYHINLHVQESSRDYQQHD